MDAPDSSGPLELVLIEDAPEWTVLVREMLVDAWPGEFVLRHFTRLAEGVRQLEGNPCDCVLLDLTLPDADGLDAVAAVRERAPDTALIVLTGRDDDDAAVAAVKQGAQDYLVKSRIDGDGLSRSIRYAIERKRSELELTRQALRDSLTGLPNRIVFMDHLERALSRLARRPDGMAVLFVDLDRFKKINDSLGHDAGDELLVTVAKRLTQAVRDGDTVARLGGDEFVVVCEDLTVGTDGATIARRMLDSLTVPVALGNHDVMVTASIGVVDMRMIEAQSAEDLVRAADVAMYRAKQRGGARYELFDRGMQARALAQLDLEAELRDAIERRELAVFYQPLIALDSGAPAGFEALVRWPHPSRGLIMPGDFIELAEQTGLIVPLGAWVLNAACRQAARWNVGRAPGELKMSVNVSPRQLVDPGLVTSVEAALRDSGLPPSGLCLEVTESATVAGPAMEALGAIDHLGVKLAIDDFGTGHSSLARLAHYPVEILKIDRSIVGGLARDPAKRRMAAGIIRLAEALELTTVAEGIETPAERDLMRTLGCDVGQGYLFARPGDAETIEDWLHQQERPVSAQVA